MFNNNLDIVYRNNIDSFMETKQYVQIYKEYRIQYYIFDITKFWFLEYDFINLNMI